jgi:hypothetical protein
MLKKEREEYKRKLRFISKHAQDIDYDWFDKDGLIVWIDDIQKKKNVYYVGYFAMDRDGIFIVFEDEVSDVSSVWDQENCKVLDSLYKKVFKEFPNDEVIDWLFKNVSLNSMLWRVNRIYQELSG